MSYYLEVQLLSCVVQMLFHLLHGEPGNMETFVLQLVDLILLT